VPPFHEPPGQHRRLALDPADVPLRGAADHPVGVVGDDRNTHKSQFPHPARRATDRPPQAYEFFRRYPGGGRLRSVRYETRLPGKPQANSSQSGSTCAQLDSGAECLDVVAIDDVAGPSGRHHTHRRIPDDVVVDSRVVCVIMDNDGFAGTAGAGAGEMQGPAYSG